MERTKLAKALGTSRSVLYRDIKRGCPTHSVAAARRWRRTHIRPQAFSEDQPRPAHEPAYGPAQTEAWLGSLYQAMLWHMSPVMTGFMVTEGLTKVQAVDGYRTLSLALMCALNDLFPDVWTKPPEQPARLDEMKELGDEAWIAKYWPDKPAADGPLAQ